MNTLESFRRFLLVVIFLGLLGIEAELLIERHTETIWHWIPIVLVALALLLLGWLVSARRAVPIRAWQVLMLAFVVSGFAGTGLHWRGKIEFKHDTDPSLSGVRLWWEAMKSQSPPALAPGAMIQLGLLGLVYAYRHPALPAKSKDISEDRGEDK